MLFTNYLKSKDKENHAFVIGGVSISKEKQPNSTSAGCSSPVKEYFARSKNTVVIGDSSKSRDKDPQLSDTVNTMNNSMTASGQFRIRLPELLRTTNLADSSEKEDSNPLHRLR